MNFTEIPLAKKLARSLIDTSNLDGVISPMPKELWAESESGVLSRTQDSVSKGTAALPIHWTSACWPGDVMKSFEASDSIQASSRDECPAGIFVWGSYLVPAVPANLIADERTLNEDEAEVQQHPTNEQSSTSLRKPSETDNNPEKKPS